MHALPYLVEAAAATATRVVKEEKKKEDRRRPKGGEPARRREEEEEDDPSEVYPVLAKIRKMRRSGSMAVRPVQYKLFVFGAAHATDAPGMRTNLFAREIRDRGLGYRKGSGKGSRPDS